MKDNIFKQQVVLPIQSEVVEPYELPVSLETLNYSLYFMIIMMFFMTIFVLYLGLKTGFRDYIHHYIILESIPLVYIIYNLRFQHKLKIEFTDKGIIESLRFKKYGKFISWDSISTVRIVSHGHTSSIGFFYKGQENRFTPNYSIPLSTLEWHFDIERIIVTIFDAVQKSQNQSIEKKAS